MKKTLIVFALTALALIIFPLAAGAYFDIQTHGGWDTSTAGCADCHTTHAAKAAFLLSNGPTQTDACYACHGTGEIASPYDVENGIIFTDYNYNDDPRVARTAGTLYPSYAGGFKNSFKFVDGSDVAQNDFIVNDTHWAASSSAHNVEQPDDNSIPGTAWDDDTVKMPGGTNIVAGNIFKCGSCHDPHAGEKANTKARLLRKNLPTNSNATIDFEADGSVNESTFRIDAYPEAINTWCGGCHDYFDAPDNAGHTADSNNKYRHPMGVVVAGMVDDESISYGTPLAKNTDELMCFSCHRAHGTAATMRGAATTFTRYNTDAGLTATSSALLRLDDRDVCYNCHGAAIANTWSYYGGTGEHNHDKP
ncbi:MAG: cytochrome c3 family protein [Thermincola sp.]|nr:cytochrome c3 family protein [Thermincola sp.]MDT3702767.1 cytochrome c3 family protein [Thermincola sp.]